MDVVDINTNKQLYDTTHIVMYAVPIKGFKSHTVFASWKAGERIDIKCAIYSYIFDDSIPKIEVVTYHGKYIDIAECDVYIEYWSDKKHKPTDLPLLTVYMNDNLWMIANQKNLRLCTLWSTHYGKPEFLKDVNVATLS